MGTELDVLKANSKDAVYGELDGFTIIENEIEGTWRHGTERRTVVQSAKGDFYATHWRQATSDEAGDFDDCNYGGLEWAQVYPTEKTVTAYV